VINGFQGLGSLRSEGGKIWSAPWNGPQPNIFLLDGKQQALGRFPNSNEANGGYLTFESHNGTLSITDNELSPTVNWTGAGLVIRKNRWIIDRCPITAQSGRTLSYTNTSQYQPVDHFGYFFQNHLRTLDQHGEWAYDKIAKQLYIYLDQNTPDAVNASVSAVDELLTINNRKFHCYSRPCFHRCQ
jgi:hypothetical protein